MQYIIPFDFQKRLDIFNWAYSISFNYWSDILDCSKSFKRQKVDISYEEAIKRVHSKWRMYINDRNERMCIELVLSSYTDPEYFIWLNVGFEHKKELLERLSSR